MLLPDPEFVRRINDKDPSAIQELLERYHKLIRDAALRTVARHMPYGEARDEADRVVTDVCLALLEGRFGFINNSLEGYLVRMVRYIAVSRFRNRLRIKQRESRSIDEADFEIPDDQPTPDVRAELSENLRLRIARLSPADQRLINKWAKRDTYEEIAKSEELPISTVRGRISRILEKLRHDDSGGED